MRSILNKIFSGRLGLSKFLISGFAFLLGLTMVLISVQAYIKINEFLNPKRNLTGYMLLNKEVGMSNTIFGTKARFTDEEVADLKAQNFTEDLGVFQTSKFEAKIIFPEPIGMSTESAFESVPDRFIDDVPSNFRWEEGSNFVPIILSQDFINLYNFSFALSRGTPQISKSTVQLLTARLVITGPGGTQQFNAKVVGFTQRIPAILVPDNFLRWANKTIGNQQKEEASRVIIKIKGDDAGNVEDYLEANGLKIDEKIKQLSRYSMLTNIVMSILFAIGTAFILFSLVIVTMNFSLIVTEAKEEIKLLIQLGYKTRYIFNYLLGYLTLFIGIVALLSAIVFVWINYILTKFLTENAIELTTSVELPVYLAGLIFVVIAYVFSLVSIRRVLRKNS